MREHEKPHTRYLEHSEGPINGGGTGHHECLRGHQGPRERGTEAEKTQGQVLGFISAQVPIRLSGEPCLGPDETSPICG